jgi:NhaA family Na+:H+ antiporter
MAEQRRFFAPHWSVTSIAHILGPMQQFVHRSASSGIMLMAATVIALALANSGLADSYNALLHTEIGITIGGYELREDLLHWINDGLMAIFFFLVGLEIKREVWVGELASVRAATLPIVAAIGGVVVPSGIYVLLNVGGVGAAGWGVPMATDIAFALGCLALLGNRIPFALKIFLTAVAIVDDLIAVLVIAFFYSGGINVAALALGFALLVVLLLANIFGIRNFPLYIVLGVIIWAAFLESGVHATIAGVLIALTIPARNRIDAPTFMQRAHNIIHEFQQGELESTPMLTDQRQQSAVIELEALCEQVQAPLQKMEHSLHNWVSFLIMPIFAFANAGVPLSLGNLGGETLFVSLGILLGLTLGKPIGLLVASWLAVRSGIAALPEGVSWRHMLGAGILAGIGFTMSLFIASLGFTDPDVLAAAKFSILIASLIAGSIGLLYLSRTTEAVPTETED